MHLGRRRAPLCLYACRACGFVYHHCTTNIVGDRVVKYILVTYAFNLSLTSSQKYQPFHYGAFSGELYMFLELVLDPPNLLLNVITDRISQTVKFWLTNTVLTASAMASGTRVSSHCYSCFASSVVVCKNRSQKDRSQESGYTKHCQTVLTMTRNLSCPSVHFSASFLTTACAQTRISKLSFNSHSLIFVIFIEI